MTLESDCHEIGGSAGLPVLLGEDHESSLYLSLALELHIVAIATS
jgi:hypothetical protein